MATGQLTLPEELMLLSLHRETGKKRIDAQTLHLILAGAVLVELALEGAIEIHDDHVQASGTASDTAYPTHLLRISEEHKPRRAQWWVEHFQNRSQAEDLCRRLVHKGILKETDSTVLGFIHVHRFPESEHDADAEIRNRLQRALAGTETGGAATGPDDRTTALIALAEAGDLLRKIIPDAPKGRVNQIVAGPWQSPSARAAVEAVAAAVSTALVVVYMGGGS